MNKELEKVMLDNADKKWSFHSTGRAGYCDGWDCAVKHLEQQPEQLEPYRKLNELADEMNVWLTSACVFNFIPKPFHSHIMDTLTKYKDLTKTDNNG